jgi:catechol 2,3-dioxygenase
VIADLGHIALRVEDLGASLDHAREILGLREVERLGDVAHLTCDRAHTRVRYTGGAAPALEHVGLVAEGPAALEELARRLDREGIIYESGRSGSEVDDALLFAGPDGHRFEVYATVRRDQPAWYPTEGLRPTRFGHVTLTAPDISVTESFLVDVLGFRVSDRIVPGIGTWLRCSSEHHVLAVLRGPTPGLHHYAFDVEDLSALGRLGDILAGHGRSMIFGPGRHGPGNNLFTYHLDPSGSCVEVCADMEKVLDDKGREIREWEATVETENLWGALAPPGFDDLCTPNATSFLR